MSAVPWHSTTTLRRVVLCPLLDMGLQVPVGIGNLFGKHSVPK